jgi:hypothetical protein
MSQDARWYDVDMVILESLLREEERVRARSGRRGEGLEWRG